MAGPSGIVLQLHIPMERLIDKINVIKKITFKEDEDDKEAFQLCLFVDKAVFIGKTLLKRKFFTMYPFTL